SLSGRAASGGCELVWLLEFFFSSRRRHTRSKRDWSSDVCSSDLPFRKQGSSPLQFSAFPETLPESLPPCLFFLLLSAHILHLYKIGRASCRERAWVSVGPVPGRSRAHAHTCVE